MKHQYSPLQVCFLAFCFFVLFSCKTAPVPESRHAAQASPSPAEGEAEPARPSPPPQAGVPDGGKIQTLTLLFGGDIMAHRQNYETRDFKPIWKDVSPLIRSADLSFANIEAPVDDSIPWSNYPRFNMHREYPEEAVAAGFNVFSLINNHTNDQGYSGIRHTAAWADDVAARYKDSSRPVYFCGINMTKGSPVSYTVIKKDGWTVVFCAITELLNSKDGREYLNYVPSDKRTREAFKERIRKIRHDNPCDLFILSVHAAEPEYVRTVPAAERSYFHELLGCGVDILWANHPHVVLEREFTGTKISGTLSKLILYANGNTISGQRRDPQLGSPYGQREYTGDGLLYKVTYTRKDASAAPVLTDTEPHYITTYITTAYQFVIKYLDDDFIQYLEKNGRTDWARYISERKKIMNKTKVTKTWQ